MKGNDIRLNWFGALSKVSRGTQLSGKIEWGFTTQDLIVLGVLHQQNLFREEIYDLLEDCNFHMENEMLDEGKYDEYFKMLLDGIDITEE